jgi:hypothetical protein
MGLASTAALVSIQDANGAVATQANGAVAFVTPGTVANFSLQSTTGVQRWEVTFNCPNYPKLHQSTFTWLTGQANLIQVPLPVGTFSGFYTSTVSDGQASIAYAQGTVLTKGSATVPLQHSARLLCGAALAAYTNVSGVITMNANGALANIDSVAPAVGDFVFLPPGIAAATTDVGLYQVNSLGGASAKAVLVLAPDWTLGAFLQSGTEVKVTEGTVYGPSTWVLTTAGVSTIGTTTQSWIPRAVTQSVTLVAGTTTIANVPVLSSTKMSVSYARTTANTTALTIIYTPIGAITAGALGTATFAFQAAVAAGTINVADISTLNVTVHNPV